MPAPLPEIVDIIAPALPPPAPPPYGWIAGACAAGLTLLCIVAYRYWRRGRARRLALRQLRQAGDALRQRRVAPRAAAFIAGRALELSAPRAIASDLRQALDRARFASATPDPEHVQYLLSEAETHLRSHA